MQTTKGLLSAEVHISGGKSALLSEISLHLPKTIQVLQEIEIPGPHNQNTRVFRIKYGPVWGGWKSDIKSHFTRAAKKAGTKATVSISAEGFKREVVEVR